MDNLWTQDPPPSEERAAAVRADIDKTTRLAVFAASAFVRDHSNAFGACTPAGQTKLVTRAVLSYLLGHGLITAAPNEVWERFLPTHISEPYHADLLAALETETDQYAEINTAFFLGESASGKEDGDLD